jgi:hypothetical protein
MTQEFLPFKKFFNDDEVQDTVEFFKKNNIDFEITNSDKYFDPSFARNSLNKEFWINIKSNDFEKANDLLNDYYSKQLDNIDKEYYLFSFSDQELLDIVLKPDEWGNLDYQLAQKLLKERGKEIKPEVIELMKTQRNEDLSKPEIADKHTLFFGYFSAILGGIFGMWIGWHMAYGTKILPDGRIVNAYEDYYRMHGKRIFVFGIICFIIWFFLGGFNNLIMRLFSGL